MTTVNPNRVGIVFCVLLAGCHLGWALLIAAGWAQPLIDFIFWIHMIKPVYVIETFSLDRAGLLVLVTGVIGYMLGVGFSAVWNRVHR